MTRPYRPYAWDKDKMEYKPCPNCGNTKGLRSDPRGKYCNRKCASAFHKGGPPSLGIYKAIEANRGKALSNEHKKKLGESHYEHGTNKGYRRLGRDKGRRLEHIYIAEQRLGRRLFKDEVVHHKDGNKQNNSLENLVVLTRSAHAKLHIKNAIRGGGPNKGAFTGFKPII